MEGNPKNYNEDPFMRGWESRVNYWIAKIRTSGIPDEYAQELEIPITEIFLKKYVQDLGRNEKEIHMFIEDLGNQLDKIPAKFQTEKDTIENMIEEDTSSLLTSQRN